MSQFKVGGKVVAIKNLTLTAANGASITIKRDSVYTVMGKSTCPRCGKLSLDVGFVDPSPQGTKTQCYNCAAAWPNGGRWFVRAVAFVPIDESEYKLVTYTKILDEIPACAQ